MVSDAIEEITEDEFKGEGSGNTNLKKSSTRKEPRGMYMPCSYHVPERYASSLYSLAWAQAVRDKPLEVRQEFSPTPSVLSSGEDDDIIIIGASSLSAGEDDDIAITGASSLETPTREGCDRVVIELENDDLLVADDMVVDSDSVMEDVCPVNENADKNLEDRAIGLATVEAQSSTDADTPMEDSEMLSIVLELEAVTLDKAQKSFGDVCTRVHDLLVNLGEMVSDCSDSDIGHWKYTSFAALQTINSAFHSLSSDQKVQHKSIHQRLLSFVQKHNPSMFLPTQIREIEIMVQDLDKFSALLNSTDNKKKDLSGVSKICSEKNLDTSQLDSPPLLDLHKDHDVVSLPSIEKNRTNGVIEIGNKTIFHPSETNAVKQNFVSSSILIPERISGRTLLDGSDDGTRDVAGEVSRTSSASMPEKKLRDPRVWSGPGEATTTKHKPVKDPISDVPSINKRQRQGLENVQMVSGLNSLAGGHQQLHGTRQVENMVMPLTYGSLQNPTVFVHNSGETLDTRSQKAAETEKICMMPGDPSDQNVLHSRSQKEKRLNDQSVTGLLLEPMPNISRQVTTTQQKDNIVSVTQTSLSSLSQPSSQGHVSHMDVGQLEGYSEQQITTIQIERMRRIQEQNELFSARKLSLVLDLDHTLLNSAMFAGLDPVYEDFLRKKEEHERGNPNRLLFRLPRMGIWTKLRPGIWNFLEKASKLFELHLNTMGDKNYATEMAKLLDPTGVLFSGRITSRDDDDDPVCAEDGFSKTKDLRGVLGLESNIIIIDDSIWVWPHNKLNLIAVERYIYFPCSRRKFGLSGPSLLEIDRDERHDNGTIASLLAVIEGIHKTFFSQQSPHKVDVRNVLSSHQRKILSGCRIVFSGIIPIGFNPHKHPLWQTAEQFGAQCTNQIDENVTHVVAKGPGTAKVNWARSTGKLIVNPGWVEASAFLYRRAKEKDYGISI